METSAAKTGVSSGKIAARLNSGLAGDENDAALALLRLLPLPKQQVKLLMPPKQRQSSCLMLGIEAAFNVTYPNYLAHMYRFGKAFQRMAAKIAIIEERAD